ncbi:MAG: DUF58 domain-containing protein [Thermoplasmata archaeon]|nr:DUF58 domain-containing protein [Thermoplasmata archaeon]
MWTLKSALLVDAGAILLLLGLVFRNYQAIVLALTLLSFVIIVGYKTVNVRLDAQRTISTEKSFEGSIVEVRLRIKNLGRKIEFLEIIDDVPPTMEIVDGSNYLLMTLARGEQFVMKYSFKCHLRGHYSLGPVRLRSRPLFGMFYNESTVDILSPITVLPRIDDLSGVQIKTKFPKIFPGALSVRQLGAGTEFYSIREYVRGDELKKVNWKAYARTGKMMVNEYDRENVSDVMIVLDSRETEGVGTRLENPLAHGARAAATLASYYLGRRDSVGVAVYTDTLRIVPIDAGSGRLFRLLDEIAAAEPRGNAPLNGVVDLLLPYISPNATVVVISTLNNDLTVREALRKLCAHHFDLIVLSPSQVDFERAAMEIAEDEMFRTLKLERTILLSEVRSYGARVIDWLPGTPMRRALTGLMS